MHVIIVYYMYACMCVCTIICVDINEVISDVDNAIRTAQDHLNWQQ